MTTPTPEQMKASIADATDAMRAAQTVFDHKRAELIAVRERINQIRSEAEAAEQAVTAARKTWRDALRNTLESIMQADDSARPDGENRLTLLAATAKVDDYRALLEYAERNTAESELAAIEAAANVEKARQSLAHVTAKNEEQAAIEKCAPILARAIAAMQGALPIDGTTRNKTTYLEPKESLLAHLGVSVDRFIDAAFDQLPQDIFRRPNFAPLDWAIVTSPAKIAQLKAQLAAQDKAA